jgi:hypothetical protein
LQVWLNSLVYLRVSLGLIVFAVVCAVIPTSPSAVEQLYSSGVYPVVQSAVTSISNRVPIALLDVAAGTLLVAGAAIVRLRVRALGIRRALVRAAVVAAGACALIYLLFLALWGLNYRRVPLEQKLVFDGARVSRDRAIAFANTAASEVNAGYAAAHAAPPQMTALEMSFAETERALGATRIAVTGIPKRSLLAYYFRYAAIDGMTDPVFLEIIINPDVLEFERPFVVAHEWAHLAGYANEAEANFVGWITCIRSDAAGRYSGWLAAYQHALGALPRSDRRTITTLDPGPLEDLRAMSARYARSSPAVRQAARGLYDEYLRANRVAEGIGSYDAVVKLMLGTVFDPRWTPARR